MTRLFGISSVIALAIAAPAIAQQTGPMAEPGTPAPASTPDASQPAPIAPVDQPTAEGQPAPVTEPAPVAQPAPATAAVEATPAAPAADVRTATIAKLVETEFPSYDVDKSGDLNQPEFSKWVLALHAKAEEAKATAKMDDAAKATWAKNAFATADVDKSKKVTKAELNSFLLG